MPHNNQKPFLIFILAFSLAFLLFMSCATGPTVPSQPQIDPYAVYKESRPRSILIMPPINRSPEILAQPAFLAASTIPLSESGYYVIPVTLSQEMFRQNGVYVAEEAQLLNIGRLYEIFGADAALYMTITRYGVRYVLLDSIVEAEASAKLIDLRTGASLWSGFTRASRNSQSSSSGDLLTTLIGAALEQIVNTLSDNAYTVGREAARKLLTAGKKDGILYGPYHYKFEKD